MPERSRARDLAIATLPKSLVSFIRNGRYRGYGAHIRYLFNSKIYRRRFLQANAGTPPSTIVLPGGCSIRVPADAGEVRDTFEYFGWKDPDAVDEFTGFMRAAVGKKTLWDVGALFGVFSLAFTLAESDRKAFAFEPNAESCMKIKECVRLNPGADVDVFDLAVGLPGEVVAFQSGFHFIATAGLEVQPMENVAQIETISVDQLIAKGFTPPDMMKIDVEGHEFDVLKGARELLLSRKPVLSLEVHPGALSHRGISPLEIAQFLEDAGYRFQDMRNRRLKKESFNHRDTFRILAI